ncbi:hypothetical protein AAF712_010900 [Marasmius tenuissimus]|uniref:Uncharacterized protein n=1 Tax=Marasmius tenuissimus TaxID=585030 RepID=A0ABR2ZLI5_9AGAR
MAARTPSKQVRPAPYPTPSSTPYSLRSHEAKPPAIERKHHTPQTSPDSKKGLRQGKGGGKNVQDEKLEQLKKELTKCRQENKRKDKQLEAVLLKCGALEAKTVKMGEEVELLRELRPTAIRAMEITGFYASNLEDHCRLVRRQKSVLTCIKCKKILNQPQVYVLNLLPFSLPDDVILAGSTAAIFSAVIVRRRGDPTFEKEKCPGKPAGPFDVHGKDAKKTWLWDQFTTGL